MDAILLGAGFATRMYPLTRNFPKPLLPVADKPVIDYLMDQLIALPGLAAIHLVTNERYHALFEKWRRTWSAGLRQKQTVFSLYNDGATMNTNRLGAVADLRLAYQCIARPAKTMVAATDIIFRFPILPLWRQFAESKHHHVIALAEKDPARLRRTGVLAFGQKNRVLSVDEKPWVPLSSWGCPALYFLQPSAQSRLEEYLHISDNHDELGRFIDFLCRKEKVYAFKLNSSRMDIGNLDSYRAADEILKREPIYA